MPMRLDLQSELFSATGGAAAEGVSNQLGRPRADRFTLLVREAVQNSWDARLAPVGGVRFHVDGYMLDKEARRALATLVFADTPASTDIRARILADEDLAVLAISDFGTRGLSGPTRGDVVPSADESTNFVDFMRYIGRPPNRAYAGGTYGFGKAAYFLASSLKTICVHTRFKTVTGMESRFMGAALGPQFETDGPSAKRFTGRHWWGRMAEDDVVDPVVGPEADQFARLLGATERAMDATGTTIYVLAPDFQGVKPQVVLADMGRALMDYFWPKLVDGPNQTPSMSFSVRWQGAEVLLPQVSDEPGLALLIQAFKAVHEKLPSEQVKLEAIASQRPKKLLGHVALLRKPSVQLKGADLATEPENIDSRMYQPVLRRPLRHIAVMRAPNFVVKYLEGPSVPYDLAEYGGVFRVDAEADTAFARAEPPTHDDWVPDLLLDPSEKTYVRVALRKLKEAVEEFVAPHSIEATSSEAHSMAAFSRLLGGLVPSLSPNANKATHPSRPPRGGAKSAASGRRAVAQIGFVDDPRTELVDGTPAMVARFQVSGTDLAPVHVIAIPKVVIADGFESEPPEGSELPQVLKWIRPDGLAAALGSPMCEVPAESGIWTVVVSIPPDAMISLTLKTETMGAQ